jgi:DNA-binding MarR family transcriptional regulator
LTNILYEHIKVNMIDVNSPERESELFAAIELFFYAFRAFTTKPDAILAERGLARLHHRILYFVARRPAQRVSDLLVTLKVSKQALHAPLKQLVALNLVEVTPDSSDGRARCLSLTTAGSELEQRLSQTQRKLMAEVFAAQGDSAEQAWRQVMAGIAGHERSK